MAADNSAVQPYSLCKLALVAGSEELRDDAGVSVQRSPLQCCLAVFVMHVGEGAGG